MGNTRVNKWRGAWRWASMFLLALGGFWFAAATDARAAELTGSVKRPNGNGLGEVIINLSDFRTRTTAPAGSFPGLSVSPNVTYTVTPQLAGHHFTPSSITFTANGQDFAANFTAIREIRTDFDNAFAPSADVSVWRPSSGEWLVNGGATTQFGLSTDILAPADFNGDGKTDNVVFRPGTGDWHLLINGAYSGLHWGTSGDIPVARDYTGDGKADYAVYRPGNGTWYVLDSVSFAFSSFQFSDWKSSDKPVPGYYDDDGKADFAVFRNGVWHTQNSATNTPSTFSFGLSDDKPVPADYDGDLKTDFAVFHPSSNTWLISDGGTGWSNFPYGLNQDKLAPADYDGDGKADIAVFRPSTKTWYIQQSSADGATVTVFDAEGQTTDLPIAAAYIPAQ